MRQPALLVVLDGVEDPRNLGAILRTVEASGADGVLLPERHSAGLSETVARASAGAIEHVKVARVGNLVQAIQALKERGIWVVGYDAAGTERWDAVDLTKPVALVLGGEGRGMRRLVREHCDHLVSIPHFGHVTSLNVSVAAGVALYEAVRQRKSVPSIVRPIPQRADVPPHVIGPALTTTATPATTARRPNGAMTSPRATRRTARHRPSRTWTSTRTSPGAAARRFSSLSSSSARTGRARGAASATASLESRASAVRSRGPRSRGTPRADSAARPPRAEEPRPQEEPPGQGEGGGAGDAARRRGRRRRRRGPRPEGAVGAARNDSEAPREPRPSAVPAANAADAGDPEARRSRRRRRRHRH